MNKTNALLKNNKITALLAVLPLLFAGNVHASIKQCDNHLLTIEQDGQVSSGSKEKLVQAYRKGSEIRVGWELDWNNDKKTDITHWADAQFLSEFEGVIFAQLTQIQQQRAVKSKKEIIFPEESNLWFGLLSSEGELTGRYSDRKGMTKKYKVRSMWCGK